MEEILFNIDERLEKIRSAYIGKEPKSSGVLKISIMADEEDEIEEQINSKLGQSKQDIKAKKNALRLKLKNFEPTHQKIDLKPISPQQKRECKTPFEKWDEQFMHQLNQYSFDQQEKHRK